MGKSHQPDCWYLNFNFKVKLDSETQESGDDDIIELSPIFTTNWEQDSSMSTRF
jgi:hypothetical protein